MEITTEFLRDEVRSGFYIPTAIKQAWATQLHILSEIDRICKKYNITYFADWGTFLGTVRHGGYIPWDDDLDISMKREDYNRFMQVADKELPEGFAIHNFERKEDHWLFLARVINKNHICYDKEHLDKYYNFPFMATVDIFVLDYLYKDEEQEQKRCEEVKYLIALADAILQGKLNPFAQKMELSKIEKKYHTYINAEQEPRHIGIALYKIAEQQMARVPEKESDRIGQIFPWVLKGSKGLPKRYYEKAINLPFEELTMPVPLFYHKVLSDRYGDYFKVHKVWGGHDYPYFEGQRKNLRAEADFELPEFTFDKTMLRQPDSSKTHASSLKSISKEWVEELERIFELTEKNLSELAYEEVLLVLPECQQLVVDFGTLIENVKGENNPCAVAVVTELERFCEALFVVYEILTDGAGVETNKLQESILGLKQVFFTLKESIKKQIIDKKVILFVATGAKQWKGFESLYKAAKSDLSCDTYVVPLPMMRKDVYGQVKMTNEEVLAAVGYDEYPDYLELFPWNSFSMEMHQPETIFIQDCYDEENECLTIPSEFYAKNLQKHTEKLVYVPSYEVEEFGVNDTVALYNMKHYVTKPGVVRADKIIVQSEQTKKLWVERLVSFAGEDTRDMWQEKLLPLGLPVMDFDCVAKGSEEKRRLLFCVGINWATEVQDEFVDVLSQKLSTIKDYVNDIQVGICMYPGDINQWRMTIGEEKTKAIEETLLAFSTESGCQCFGYAQEKLSHIVDLYHAYYGCPSPLAHSFNYKKKPVMLISS